MFVPLISGSPGLTRQGGEQPLIPASHGEMRLRLAKLLLLASLCLAAPFALLFVQAPGQAAARQKPAAGSAPASGDLEPGKRLFNSKCAICHYRASPAKKIGPGLKGLFKRGTYADGKPVDDASLRAWIEKGGKDMPGFKDSLSAEQIRELVAYLKML